MDFDLSWHRDANELSVVNPAAATGYLAPEQIRRGQSESTRHAAVDSFGLGMTLFFLCTGQEPLFAEHQHVGWSERLKSLFKKRECKSWRSLPARMARLVEYSTCDKQTERWDLAQIEGELQRLSEANASPESVDSAELIAEELAVRSGLDGGYDWDPDAVCVRARLLSAVEVVIAGIETTRHVQINLSWNRKGEDDWRRVGKWIPEASNRAVAALSKAYWAVDTQNRTAQSVSITASADVRLLRKRLNEMASSITCAVEHLRFG